MTIRYAQPEDLEILSSHDHHIAREELQESIRRGWVLMLWEGEEFLGWLRFNLFWDNTPFMNMLFLLEGRRGQGLGGRLVDFWEQEMKARGYSEVLTSTLSNEGAQHFYRAHGYADCGSLLLPGEPLEILFRKEL